MWPFRRPAMPLSCRNQKYKSSTGCGPINIVAKPALAKMPLVLLWSPCNKKCFVSRAFLYMLLEVLSKEPSLQVPLMKPQ
jgi:hypothetical protein